MDTTTVTEAKRRAELERAWRYSENSMWFWFFFCFGIVFLFLAISPPAAEHHHHRRRHSHNNFETYPFVQYAKVEHKATRDLPILDSAIVKEWRGKNAGYEGCITDEERTQLDAALGPMDDLQPTLKISLNESSGEIEFVVEAPYVAMDGAFIATFEPMPTDWKRGIDPLHKPGTCQSSGAFEKSETLWAHAPNALYAEAFNKSVLYGSEWDVYALSCSRFAMQWKTTADKLKSCRNSDQHTASVVFSATPTAVSVSGTVWLHYIRPVLGDDEDIEYRSWPFSFAFYIDQYESKALVSDMQAMLRSMPPATEGDIVAMHASTTLKWVVHTSIAKTWFTPEEDGADAKDTELHKERALRMSLETTTVAYAKLFLEATENLALNEADILAAVSASTPHYKVEAFETFFTTETEGVFRIASADFLSELEANAKPQCRFSTVVKDYVACTKTWTIVLVPGTATPELYQGSFEAKLCEERQRNCSAKKPSHKVRFDIAITDPSTDVIDVEQMQTEITSHLNSAATRQIHEEAFVGGDRVCMQTYAVGAPELMQSIDVRTVAAWLCVDDERESSKEAVLPHNPHRIKATAFSQRSHYLSTQASATTGCQQRRHYIQIYGEASPDSLLTPREIKKAKEITAETYKPTLHEPGAYGTWSSALCFNISSLFLDYRGNSVYRQRFYFQSEVVVMPTEKRRGGISSTSHRTFASYESVALAADKMRPDATFISQEVRTAPADLTSPQLGNMLNNLDASKKLERFHTATFDVKLGKTSKENHLYHVTQATSISVFFLVLILAMCIVASTFACLFTYYNRKNADKEEGEEGKKDDKKPLRT